MNTRLGTTITYQPNGHGLLGKLDSYPTLSYITDGLFWRLYQFDHRCAKRLSCKERGYYKTTSIDRVLGETSSRFDDCNREIIPSIDLYRKVAKIKLEDQRISSDPPPRWLWETGQVISTSRVFTHNQRKWSDRWKCLFESTNLGGVPVGTVAGNTEILSWQLPLTKNTQKRADIALLTAVLVYCTLYHVTDGRG